MKKLSETEWDRYRSIYYLRGRFSDSLKRPSSTKRWLEITYILLISLAICIPTSTHAPTFSYNFMWLASTIGPNDEKKNQFPLIVFFTYHLLAFLKFLIHNKDCISTKNLPSQAKVSLYQITKNQQTRHLKNTNH